MEDESVKRKIRTADIQIDIVDFLLEFVRKAWVIVVCTVVCAAGLAIVGKTGIGGGLNTSIKTELTADEEVLLEEFEILEAEKTENDKYIKDSVVMNLNTNQIHNTSILYYIDAEENEEAIASCYKNYIESYRLAGYIASKDVNVFDQDIRDLVIAKSLDSGSVLEIRIRGNDKAFCDKIEAYLKDAFSDFKVELTAVFGEHQLEIIGTSNSVNKDVAFAQRQTDYKKEYDAFVTSFNSMKAELIEANLIKNDGDINSADGRSLIYFVVIGAVIGAVIGVVIIIMFYVMTDTIKTIDDLGNVIGLYCFGNVNAKKKEEANKQIEVIAKKIYTTCTNTNEKELLLVANVDSNTRQVVEACVEKLSACGINTRLIEDLNNSEENVIAIKKDKPIVFVESLRKTKYSSAIKDIEYCNLQGADIWGYITVLY